MKQLHEIQLKILKKLIFKKSLHFNQLKEDPEIENSKFVWHLNQLLKVNYIEKINEEYSLSIDGKVYIQRLDTDTNKIEIQSKIGVWLICIRGKGKNQEFLMYRRKKHPYYDKEGFPGGKVKLGETFEEAANRELKEECNLEGKAQIIYVWHYVLRTTAGELREDKCSFLCRFVNPTGKINQINEEGEYYWIKKTEIANWLKNPFTSIDETLKIVNIANTIKTPIFLDEDKFIDDKF